MPGLNVRGDRHLNFTPTEAAAWLGEVRHHAPRVDHNNDAMVGVFGVVVLVVILTIIGAVFHGSTPTQKASNASGTSVQPRKAVTKRTSRVRAPRAEATLQNIPSPIATSQDSASPVTYMPAGWFYGRLQGELLLRNKEGGSMGGLPDGTMFFGTTLAGAVQIIVAADGSYWGFGELKSPESAPPVPITPEFEKAAGLIGQLEAFGIAKVFSIYNSHELGEAYLPATWSMGCLAQDQPLFDSINGTRIGTIKKGTRLLYQIENLGDWRLVVAADGSFSGYTCIRPLNGVPERTPMRPEYRGGVALIHRLESGYSPRAFANAQTPWAYGPEEQ
ncbi:MAG: hypothetical protein WAQ52_00880 [Terriglobales bacterium]